MLDELTAWGRSCGLKFNPEKSVAVVFTRRRKLPPKALVIDGKEIQYKQSVPYLGVKLDSKLHWTPHINEKLDKTKRFLGNIAQITRKNWGPKPKLMRWAYLGVVRPMLCYGAMIWGHRAPELEAKLRRINRMAINTFANFPKSTPTRALEIMLDILPLHLFCEKEAIAARTRLDKVIGLDWPGTNGKKTHSKSHLRHWQDRMMEHGLNIEEVDGCNIKKWNNAFKVNTESFSGATKHRVPTQFNVYTDGSKQNGRAGCGLVVYRGQRELCSESYHLPDHATVFQAEVTAIQRAAEKLSGLSNTAVNFVKILVDSRAAIMALMNPSIKSRTVSRAVEALNTLADRTKSVTIVWVPAHKGHIGNERADVLAKAGAASNDPEIFTPIEKPVSAFKQELRTKIYETWTKEWTQDNEAHHAKGFYCGPDARKAKYVYKLARLELGRFARIVTGHNNLNYFQSRIGLSRESRCRWCLRGNETILHFINECPRFVSFSRDMFLGNGPRANNAWSVRTLLDFSYIPGINEAYEGSWTGSEVGAEMINDTLVSQPDTDEDLDETVMEV